MICPSGFPHLGQGNTYTSTWFIPAADPNQKQKQKKKRRDISQRMEGGKKFYRNNNSSKIVEAQTNNQTMMIFERTEKVESGRIPDQALAIVLGALGSRRVVMKVGGL